MGEHVIQDAERTGGYGRRGLFDRWAETALRARLERLSDTRLLLVDGDQVSEFGSPGAALCATITVHRPRFYRALVLRGPLGAAEAYMDGDWSCDDLVALVRIVALEHESLGFEVGRAGWLHPLLRVWHGLRGNTRFGSRRNVHAHYDLGNEFFALFLDPTLTYSCGIFEREGMTMEEASIAKYERVCRKLALGPADHVLEIGAGWGGFALHAASLHGCRVTTTTISREQHELARKRVALAGLEARIEVLLEDYRDLRGEYDKLVSIEMIEAVGDRHLPGFFRVCSERLKPNGAMLLQAITNREQDYAKAVRHVDFIKRYIFPGGQLVSVGAVCAALARATDLRLTDLEDITPHYAETLRRWRERMFSNLKDIRALGLPQRFIAMWEFYLCYCEGGFRERAIGAAQLLLEKPASRLVPADARPA